MSSGTRVRARRAAIAGTAVALGLSLTAATHASGANSITGRNILIADSRFVPADIGVFPGTTVVWTNTDDAPHDVHSTEGPRKFGTGEHPLKNGESFRFTFTQRGVYRFEANLNMHAVGSITVGERAYTEPPADEPPAHPVPLPSATPSPLLPRDHHGPRAPRPPRPLLPAPPRPGPFPR
ncbi:MAG TPA: cupredoxin domain-containing protein [Sporichthyaceae bacterium]|jgi:plastocyanin|nr:cupredoxin domain-containing protein [Sporichthyaceae bacterium]